MELDVTAQCGPRPLRRHDVSIAPRASPHKPPPSLLLLYYETYQGIADSYFTGGFQHNALSLRAARDTVLDATIDRLASASISLRVDGRAVFSAWDLDRKELLEAPRLLQLVCRCTRVFERTT